MREGKRREPKKTVYNSKPETKQKSNKAIYFKLLIIGNPGKKWLRITMFSCILLLKKGR